MIEWFRLLLSAACILSAAMSIWFNLRMRRARNRMCVSAIRAAHLCLRPGSVGDPERRVVRDVLERVLTVLHAEPLREPDTLTVMRAPAEKQ